MSDATRCPFAAWRPIGANYTHGGRQQIRGVVPHVQVGTGSLWGFFNTPKAPGSGASADFWCSKTGVLEQYVDLADQSWAQGSTQHNGNPYFVSCEFEGMPDEDMTAQQLDMGGRLTAWVYSDVDQFPLVVNTDPNGSGVTPHHVFGGGHTCPGPGPRENQFPDLIAAALRWLAPTPPQEDEVPAPAVLIDPNGDVFTFVRGTDGFLWFQKGHGQWAQVPGDGLPGDKKLTSGPSVSQHPHGVTVAVRGPDGATWINTFYDGVWVGWDSYGGSS